MIGVIGADGLADELEQTVTGGTVHGYAVTVRRLRNDEPASGVDVLFVGRSQNDRLGEILAASKGRAMLTVTESQNGLALGSMINFVMVDCKLRSEVAPKAAGAANQGISARLLGAAYKVAPRPS